MIHSLNLFEQNIRQRTNVETEVCLAWHLLVAISSACEKNYVQ